MIQFYLSKDLAKDLSQLSPVQHQAQPEAPSDAADDADSGAVIWYAHRVTIMRRKCIIAMELQSRYAMVFCGLTKPDFNNFPKLFGQRLLQEACVITQLHERLPEADVQLLCELANEISVEQNFTLKSDRSVQSHINQVKEHLEDLVLRGGYPLPTSDDDAMRFGLIANDMLRKTKNHKDYFVPLEVYGDFWLGLIRHVKEHVAGNKPAEPQAPTASQQDNEHRVIPVDFVNKRRR